MNPAAQPSAVAVTAEAIDAHLRATLAPSALEVIDESADHMGHVGSNGTGSGTHFRVRIAAPGFTGRTRVACHRLVYDALRSFLDAGLHALAIEIQPSAPPQTQPQREPSSAPSA